MFVNRAVTIVGCLGCFLFPTVAAVMVMTYEQTADWGEPGPFPYSHVDYIFLADLLYTAMLILAMRVRRTVIAFVAVPLLVVTAVMVFFAGMWFSGNYL